MWEGAYQVLAVPRVLLASSESSEGQMSQASVPQCGTKDLNAWQAKISGTASSSEEIPVPCRGTGIVWAPITHTTRKVGKEWAPGTMTTGRYASARSTTPNATPSRERGRGSISGEYRLSSLRKQNDSDGSIWGWAREIHWTSDQGFFSEPDEAPAPLPHPDDE